MVKVNIGKWRPQDAHYGFYQETIPSGDIVIVRRKVGEPTDYLHPNSRKLRIHRRNFGLASTHYSHLTPIQKKELKYVGEIVSFVRGHSKSDTKFLQGRPLFISKDTHALDETQTQIPTPLQICIVLTDPDLNPIEGDLRLYYLEDGEWKETTHRLLSPSYWLFPTVPRNKQLYHPIGADFDYYDPQDPDTTYLTQKELMLYHYHPLTLRPIIETQILRPNRAGDLCQISNEAGEPCPNHWMNVDEEVPDEDETWVGNITTGQPQRDLYRLETPTPSLYAISRVIIVIRFKRLGSYPYGEPIYTILKTHNQTFEHSPGYGSWEYLDDLWGLEENPATNEPWTEQELTDLQVGIQSHCWKNWDIKYAGRCTQLYAKAEYYAPQ
jgi:hypothetical protein